MEQIIDVEYREIENLKDKTIEQLAGEANILWSQMESISNIGMMMAAQAGRRLTVIKNRLDHGAWERWAKDNLNFSLRKANNMMKLAEKVEDENSLFSNPQIFADIGISKVWALLAAPEEVAEEAIQNPDLPDMTVKDLQTEIQKLKEKNANLEDMIQKSEEESTAAEIALHKRVKELETSLKNRQGISPEVLEKKEKELQTTKDKLEKEKEKLNKLKETTNKEKDEIAAEAMKKAEDIAKAKYEEATRQLKESNEQAAKEIDRLQKLAGSNTELAIFKVKSEQLQQDFNACLTSIIDIEADDQEKATKLRHALRVVMEKLIERIEE